MQLRARQHLGKYRVEKRLAEGGFSTVYQAQDTIEGIRVALKLPHTHVLDGDDFENLLREVRINAKLDHPHVMAIKNAGFIDDHFVIAYPLGERSLADRLGSRLSANTALDYADQILSAIAHAHEHKVIHCDIKPDNIIMFDGNQLKLTDFGLAKVSMRTRGNLASGAGTVGYIAPEQALGKPSLRSDVFSVGLLVYRMLTGHLPTWPFEWPYEGSERLRRTVSAEFVTLLRRCLAVREKDRFKDGVALYNAFLRIKKGALLPARRSVRPPPRESHPPSGRKSQVQWKSVRFREFQKQFGRLLEAKSNCSKCRGPVSETMRHCPWCGDTREVHDGDVNFPSRCGRCERGAKNDWKYCAWCYGPAFDTVSSRTYSDVRYDRHCANARCQGELMPFMRYCPWCRTKVRHKWAIEGSEHRCSSCGWGALPDFWSFCPWCSRHY